MYRVFCGFADSDELKDVSCRFEDIEKAKYFAARWKHGAYTNGKKVLRAVVVGPCGDIVYEVIDEQEDIINTKKDTRPSWDDYFLRLAKDVSSRSNCSRRKVGAIITKDKHIVSTGYNGTPPGTTNCFLGGCPRCNKVHKTGEGLDECLCVHAEQNAICQAAKHGNAIDGGCMYITCSPCLTCLKLIINAGIKRVVFSEWYREFNEQERNLIKEAGIEVEHRSC